MKDYEGKNRDQALTQFNDEIKGNIRLNQPRTRQHIVVIQSEISTDSFGQFLSVNTNKQLLHKRIYFKLSEQLL